MTDPLVLLQQRVDELEAAVESLNAATSFLAAVEGTLSRFASNQVLVQGVELAADTFGYAASPADRAASVRWRSVNGAIVANLYAYDDPGPGISGLAITAYDPNDQAVVNLALNALHEDGSQASMNAESSGGFGISNVRASAQTVGSSGYSSRVIESTGSSDFVRKTSWLAANGLDPEITAKHWGAATPTGGHSGDVAVGNGVIWVNDAGTWKSVPVT